MDTPWTVNGFVGTPDIIENESNDFFQLVPPTPRYNLHAHSQAQAHAYTHPAPSQGYPSLSPLNHQDHEQTFEGFTQPYNTAPFEATSHPHPHQLRQSESNMSLRSPRSESQSHRSSSSVSSHMGWSTIGSDTASLTDPEAEADLEDVRSISPSILNPNQQQGHNALHGRVPSLSIDPKLFAPKDKDESEMLATARPKGRGKKGDIVGKPATATAPVAAATEGKSGTGKKGKKGTAGGGEGKKVSHARKQNADHIPRPRNAFILFRKHVVDSKLIPASVEMRHQNVSIITAKMWSEAPPVQKAHFNDLARIEKEEHMKKYPGYRYQPVYRRTNVIRRRVRKDEAEEEKCKSVAELLIKGKSGEDLVQEIKEKIRHGSDSGSISTEIKESTSRRSSAACELSKGALRALRAQARQQVQGSGEWSDISRSGSIDPDFRVGRTCRRTSYAVESSSNSASPEPMLGFGLAPSQMQGFAQAHSHAQAQDRGLEQADGPSWSGLSPGMAHVHPGLNEFTFGQPHHQQFDLAHEQNIFPNHDENDMQNFHFPPTVHTHTQDQGQMGEQVFQPLHIQTPSFSASSQHTFSSDPTSSQSHTQSLLYPQPGLDLHLGEAEFYAYDTALPFSPAAGTFSFHTGDDAGGNAEEDGMNYFQFPQSHYPSQAEDDYKSPNTMLPVQGQAQAQGQVQVQVPLSARWDGSLLPPSAGVPLEGLFDDGGIMLGDFEAALAHADEVGGW